MTSFTIASPFSLTHAYSLQLRRRTLSIFTSPINLRSKNPRFLRLSASLAESWFPPRQNQLDNYGGWAVIEAPAQNNKKKKGLPTIVIAGIGSSLAVLLTTIACFSLSRKGFKFQFGSPLHALHGMLNWTETKSDESRTRDSSVADIMVSEEAPECISDATGSMDKLERVIVSVAVDTTQQEALSVLKKLKIIEDDVRADQLCTRREYARWLVCINSLLERNPKHRIVPSILLSGSVIAAFDDVSVDDPDFESIQALAEAGIVPSKLSGKNSIFNGSEGQGGVYFFPESFISRQDLINWKAQVEYEFKPEMIEQSRYQEQK